MNKLYPAILAGFLAGCSCSLRTGVNSRPSEVTYQSRLDFAAYKVGDTITIPHGLYTGCKIKVERVEPKSDGVLYWGSNSCTGKVSGWFQEE